ncbi:MAG: HEPN domain-containing protein [Spirochaetia bacterium]|nr:HEPN domain-containing protein [Spirochaetia bacterium]
MTQIDLARAYLKKLPSRLQSLKIFFDAENFSDVVRESQELLELALKAILRTYSFDPPKYHDVGKYLLNYKDRLPITENELQYLIQESTWLRGERELSMYGEEDFFPDREYSSSDAVRAISAAKFAKELAEKVVM